MIILGALFWTTTGSPAPPPPVTVDTHDPTTLHQPDLTQPDWEQIRKDRARLRGELEVAYSFATGKPLQAPEILAKRRLPESANLRPIIARIRELEAVIAGGNDAWMAQQQAFQAASAERQRMLDQDDEEAVYLLFGNSPTLH